MSFSKISIKNCIKLKNYLFFEDNFETSCEKCEESFSEREELLKHLLTCNTQQLPDCKPKLEEGEELLVVEEFPSERPGYGLRYYKKLSE